MGFRKGVAVTLVAGAVAAGAAIQAGPAFGAESGMVRGVVALTNTMRARSGCGPVSSSPRLSWAAWQHSRDMAGRGYFSHGSPGGGSPGSRVRAAGYSWSAYGENIAWGQRDARAVMNAWMNSPGHRANILNCRFRNVGVAVAYDYRGVPYWTQDFASPW
ncbi:CAP domain-containing protein [Dactylosporangium vinaceum]|uniref:CAP domain-containing protein n=1 Tax=Dactylosporangium vinaceum TaxID=53362 RepID=A0ABV5MCK7_9ACTN|nr:CAP domain-containing protein [Dactylosporangium vinaceum]UAB92215.1 CAP domain-containing protein [Dactylosporangium vinaceum]